MDSTDLLGAAQASHCTVLIVTAQTSCHIAVDESNCNQLAYLITANQWNFASLEGKVQRPKTWHAPWRVPQCNILSDSLSNISARP